MCHALHLQVVLTDYEDKVLRNLRECMAMNFADSHQQLMTCDGPARGAGPGGEALDITECEDDMFADPEDAEECDSLDFLNSSADGGGRHLDASQLLWGYVSAPSLEIAPLPCAERVWCLLSLLHRFLH